MLEDLLKPLFLFFLAMQSTKEKVAIKKITKNHLKPHDHDALKSEVALLKECAGQANVLAFKDFFEEASSFVVPPINFFVFSNCQFLNCAVQ